ncbi:MAG: hypothetical protein ACO4CT_02355, partial [Planctomycetota bacterium]
ASAERGDEREAERGANDRGRDRAPREERGSARGGRDDRPARTRDDRRPRRDDEAPTPRPARPRRAAQADVALEIEIAPASSDAFGAGVLEAGSNRDSAGDSGGSRSRRRR